MRRHLGALAALAILATVPIAASAQEGETQASAWTPAWNEWTLRKPITIDTTPAGVNLAGAVGRAPLLVRLHGGNFEFAEAAESGADLRFVDSDGRTPLAHHIESWDAQTGIANVWVDAPGIAGGAAKTIYLYYGKKDAPSTANTPGSFDADHLLVYHFEEAAGQPVTDETSFKSVATGTPAGVATGGAIGRAARFEGTGLTLANAPALAVPAGGPFTISFWVRQDAPAPDAAIYANRAAGGGLVVGLANGAPYVQVGATRVTAPAPLTAGRFTHVAAASDGATVRLFVDGRAAGEAAAPTPALSGPIAIGGDATAPFTGLLDELRVSKVARAANQFALDAGGQSAQTRLVAVAEVQEQGAGGGVIGFILSKIEAVDWAIIGLCMALLAGAILVAITKLMYLNRANAANAVFLKRFRRMEGELVSLDKLSDLGAAERADLAASPLARLYETGIEELDIRKKRIGARPLSGESVEAMRAAVDAQQIVENHKLDRAMVLLTIAISGGPFIGLLGTVIGVMVVFGGVALAGDVNVNAIAPGIAAALMATIAGLAAAIPSLFFYNYLNSRITALSDDMRTFVDRLITRLAEAQADAANDTGPPSTSHRLAAE